MPKVFPLLMFVMVLAIVVAPASAQTGLCSSTCTTLSPCDKDCYDTGGPVFFSTCGAYGVCTDFPDACVDPKDVSTQVVRTPTGSTVTATWCHEDHWFPFDPFAWPRYYDYTLFTYRDDVIRTTEYCDGTIDVQVVSSSTFSASCAQRTWATCPFPFGPPPLTCAP